MKNWLCICLLVLCSLVPAIADTLDRRIHIERSRGSVYELLNKVSERSQMLFIYEEGVVRNDQRARIAAGTYALRDAILLITGEKDLQMRVIDSHILLFKNPGDRPNILPLLTADSLSSGKIAEGYVRDGQTREAIPHCYVVLEHTGMGTVTNLDGRFVLKIPDSLSDVRIAVTHIGYRSRTLSAQCFLDGKPDIYIYPEVIQLQEVVVRYVPAQKIIREMLANRSDNYAADPAYFTSFYREGTEYEKNFVTLTEGVCQIYKPGFGAIEEDQVKLLKMRHVRNPRYPDSILIRIQAGVRASLLLDIVRHLPDFLSADRESDYHYTRVGMEYIDSGMVHAVAFEQKPEVREPLLAGTLYVDTDRWALVKAEFEVSPRHIRQVGPDFVLRKSKDLNVEAQKITYTVSYQQWNGYYWVSHVRGDLQFKIRRKRGWFGNTRIWNAFFEMATCAIDTKDVRRFPSRERLPAGQIFSQTQFVYDADFWERFNTILPEERLTKAIARLLLTVEEQIDDGE